LGKGKETEIKMRLWPNTRAVDLDYILKTLLNLSKKKEKTDLVPAAKQILLWTAKRGDDGLYSQNWEENAKTLKITQSQYFHILNTLKRAGMIYKSKGKFYISKVFAEHIKKIYTTLRDYMDDLGAV